MQLPNIMGIMLLLLFTDFGAAFPSLIHQWLLLVMKHLTLPAGFINFIEGIYFAAVAVGKIRDRVAILFLILSGVIQGCPLASDCFVIAFDPFLNFFNAIICQKGLGNVHACVDDVGCALRSICTLSPISRIFKLANVLAGLDIKFRKSCVVPLVTWTSTTESTIKACIASSLPGRRDISVAQNAKYLGTFLGTNCRDASWRAPTSLPNGLPGVQPSLPRRHHHLSQPICTTCSRSPRCPTLASSAFPHAIFSTKSGTLLHGYCMSHLILFRGLTSCLSLHGDLCASTASSSTLVATIVRAAIQTITT